MTTGTEDVPTPFVQGALVLIIVYFGLLALAFHTGDAVLHLAADVVFGVVAIGLGGMLGYQADAPESPLGIAAVAFVLGGLSQFAAIGFGEPIFETFTTVSVIVGIAAYVFAIVRKD